MATRRARSTATIGCTARFSGPSFGEAEIKDALDRAGARYRRLPEAELLESVAAMLAEGAVVGWFQGRMEFGPRALGNRSILGDPRNSKMQSVMNLKIKYRESFRPFAPAVLVERAADYFELDRPSPYMALVANVREELRQPMSDEQHRLFGIDKLNVPRSSIPAVTHVDYSARIQSVDARTNPRFHRLLERFAARTGCAVLVNTSFNVRGEPIVCTPEDAYRCFMRTEMDVLVLGGLRARQDRSARAPARRELEARVRAGLTGGDGAEGRGAATQVGVAQFRTGAGRAVRGALRRAAPAAPSHARAMAVDRGRGAVAGGACCGRAVSRCSIDGGRGSVMRSDGSTRASS